MFQMFHPRFTTNFSGSHESDRNKGNQRNICTLFLYCNPLFHLGLLTVILNKDNLPLGRCHCERSERWLSIIYYRTVMNLLYSLRDVVRYADASYACMYSLEIIEVWTISKERAKLSMIYWIILIGYFFGYKLKELLLWGFMWNLWQRLCDYCQLHFHYPTAPCVKFVRFNSRLLNREYIRNEITITQSLFHGVSRFRTILILIPTIRLGASNTISYPLGRPLSYGI